MDVDFGRYGNFDDFIGDLLGHFGVLQGGGFQSSGFPGGGYPEEQPPRSSEFGWKTSEHFLQKPFAAVNEPSL